METYIDVFVSVDGEKSSVIFKKITITSETIDVTLKK